MATTHPMTTYAQPDVRAAAGVNDAFLLAGRILIALIFVSSGFHKFTDLTATAASIELQRSSDAGRARGRHRRA